jgi:hypothetical protein
LFIKSLHTLITEVPKIYYPAVSVGQKCKQCLSGSSGKGNYPGASWAIATLRRISADHQLVDGRVQFFQSLPPSLSDPMDLLLKAAHNMEVTSMELEKRGRRNEKEKSHRLFLS